MVTHLLERFDPDPEGLLREISQRTSDDVLERISTADYAAEADIHLAALRHLRDTGTFREPMHWFPAEVLELIRWSEPEDPDWKPGELGELGHWMRAFSCAALLRATAEPWNYGDGIGTDSTAAQLLLSLEVLPHDFTLQAAKFFAWLLQQKIVEVPDEQICAYGAGLFWCALKHPSHFADESLVQLGEWVMQYADAIYDEPVSEGAAFMFGCGLRRMVIGCQTMASWEALALKLLDRDLSNRSSQLRAMAEVLCESLLGKTPTGVANL